MLKKYGDNTFYFFFLIFIFLLFGYLTFNIFKPFLSAIGWAIVFSMLFYPVYVFILKYVRWKPVASLVTTCLIIIVILGPVSYLIYMLLNELQSVINTLKAGTPDAVKILDNPIISKILTKVLGIFDISEEEFHQTLIQNLTKFGKEFMGGLTKGLGNIVSTGLNFIFVFLSIFFLLEDGPSFLNKLSSYLPFSDEQRKRLIDQTRNIVISTIYGGVTVALVQAIIGAFAFLFLGFESPALWGMGIFITSFVPLLGTFIIWGPATGYLIFNGALLKAIVLAIVGVFGISMADNILRPLIVKGRTRMPVLIIFFSILGGINFFGFIGFILGPLIVALFISVTDIFRLTTSVNSNDQSS